MNHLGIQIAGWEALSPIGIGSTAFAGAGLASEVADGVPDGGLDEQSFPTDIRYRPARFDVAEILGSTKGIRTIDRTTALGLCTSHMLRERLAGHGSVPLERTGFVIGTSTGSIRSTSDFTRESLVQPRPFLVNPAFFPNTVMNCTAGQCGIRFKTQSVNATIAGGRLSGLIAFKYAMQMLRRGYVDLLFTGSVEELCPQTAWAHRLLVEHGQRYAVPLGEGCGLFILARPDEVRAVTGGCPATDVLALQYGRYFTDLHDTSGQALSGVLACIGDALEQAGIGASAISACVLCGTPDVGQAELEQQAAASLFGHGTHIYGADLVERFGDTYSATFALALAWLLAQLDGKHGGMPAHGLVLMTSEDGHAGCLIVRTHPAEQEIP